MTGQPGKACCHAGSVEFGNLRHNKAWGSQIESNSGDGVALEGRGAGRRVPGNRDLRKLPKVKVKPTVASIWMLMLAEKTTPVLAAIKHNV